MREILVLLKKELYISYGFVFNLKTRWKSPKSRRNIIFSIVFFIFFLVYFGFIYKNILYLVDDAIKNSNIDSLIFSMMFIMTILVLFIGLPTIINKLVYNNNINILIRLPLKIKNIIASDIISLSIGFVTYCFIFVYPMLFLLGFKMNYSIIYYILVVINSLFVLIINVSVIFLISTLLSYILSKLPGIKNAAQYIAMILFYIIFLGIGFGVQSLSMNTGNSKGLSYLFSFKSDGLLPSIFPHIKLYMNSLINIDSNIIKTIIYTMILLVIAVLSIIVIMNTCDKLFLGIVRSGKTKAKKIKLGSNKQNNILTNLLKIEFRTILKNPSIAMNVVMPIFIFPVIIIVAIILASTQSEEALPEIKSLVDTIKPYYQIIISLAIGMLYSYFTSGLQPATLSTISRHKETLWLMQVLPIKPELQLRAKLLMGLIMNMISAPLIIGLLIYTVGLRPLIIFGFIIGLFIGWLLGLNIGLLLEVLMPKLDWTELIKSVKSNPVYFISMIICYATIFAIGYPFYLITKDKSFNAMLNILDKYILLVALVFILLIISLYTISVKIYSKILSKY